MDNLHSILETSRRIASKQQHEYFSTEHILFILLQYDEVHDLLELYDCDADLVIEFLEKYFQSFPRSKQPPKATIMVSDLEKTIKNQLSLMGATDANNQEILNFFFYMDRDEVSVQALLYGGFDFQKYKQEIEKLMENEVFSILKSVFEPEQPKQHPKRSSTPALDKFAIDLNKKAANSQIDPLIGREREVEALLEVVLRRQKNNALLLGEPGVGKTAIIEGLAKKAYHGEVPAAVTGLQVYALDNTALNAGAKFRGDIEERVLKILSEIEKLSEEKQIILFVDEIHSLMTNRDDSVNLPNLLKPYLSRGVLRCVGATTYDEHRKNVQKDKAFLRRFTILDITEPSIEDSIAIANGLLPYYENYHGVDYDEGCTEAAVRLSRKYIQNRYLPDKALDILDAAAARLRLNGETQITVAEIERTVSKIANIPEENASSDETKKLASLKPNLKKIVFGQDHAIETLANSVLVARAGMKDPSTPEGVYLFVGPTGVGKTEIAKGLASELGVHFEKFDMSEFMERHSVSKLIGSPPGYVGYSDNGGRLTNVLEKHPHSVILLDEFEKAHPDVHNIFLQVFDYGTITNSNDKTVSARNAIFLLTSNSGAKDAEKGSIGFGRKSYDDEKQDEALNVLLSPEFRNRLDGVIKFNKLSKENLLNIVDKFIDELNFELQPRNVKVILNKSAKDQLLKEGYDEAMGARPMKRIIRQEIKVPLSQEILFGKLKNGGEARVSYTKSGWNIKTK